MTDTPKRLVGVSVQALALRRLLELHGAGRVAEGSRARGTADVMPVRFIKQPAVLPSRTCGGCTLCCKVFDVAEVGSPKDRWCRHASKGVGCDIHAARPDVCRNFECLWVQGVTAEIERPDRVHGVLTPTKDGKNLQIQEDPGYPGHATRSLVEFISRFIADGEHYVVVVTGSRRRLIARPDRIASWRHLIDTGQVKLQDDHGQPAEGVDVGTI